MLHPSSICTGSCHFNLVLYFFNSCVLWLYSIYDSLDEDQLTQWVSIVCRAVSTQKPCLFIFSLTAHCAPLSQTISVCEIEKAEACSESLWRTILFYHFCAFPQIGGVIVLKCWCVFNFSVGRPCSSSSNKVISVFIVFLCMLYSGPVFKFVLILLLF